MVRAIACHAEYLGGGIHSPSSRRVVEVITRAEAWELLTEWVSSESLRRHCLAVEAAMRAYAARDGADEELWGVTGLLHDADYERYPDLETGHPRIVMAELERRGAPAEMVRAIACHADYLGFEANEPIERTLLAVDELCGFLIACAVVRPTGIHGLSAKSVRKKLKQPSFAAAVNRADVQRGADLLEIDFNEHIAFVIAALEPHAVALGVDGSTS
jgi:putative nucleotidyltransferase with HDIG domain